MKRARQPKREDTATDNNKKKQKGTKLCEKDLAPGAGDEGARQSSSQLGLECVGDDALLHIMQLCGPVEAARAFLFANRRLHALVRSHRLLWRSAYTRLFADDGYDGCEDDDDDDEDDDAEEDGIKDSEQSLQQHLAGVEDYFEAYGEVMRQWSGKFEFSEDDVPLAEDDGELVIKVDAHGRATWEGHGVGCGRAGEYTSLNCLKGEGQLHLRLDRKGRIRASVKGRESDVSDTCERGDDDEDEDDEDGDEDDEEDETQREKRKEQKEEERAEKENYSSKWVEESLKSLKPPFSSPVTYRLHSDKGEGKRCMGGGACTAWHEDMEW